MFVLSLHLMHYLFSKQIDLLGIYFPFTLLWISFLFVPETLITTDFPTWAWVIFVVGFDVSHVWSTLFRTYLSKQEFKNHKQFLVLGPPVIFAITFSLAFLSIDWFWRILAYIAVFHFIRQQYGFLALYRVRKGIKLTVFQEKLDKLIIYLATGVPVLIWHLQPNSAFHWFVEGDFISITNSESVYFYTKWFSTIVFGLLFLYWLWQNLKQKIFSLGAALWVSFTVLNWFGAIVFINSDYVFTLTNVVAHGLPYLILIVYYKSKSHASIINKSLLKRWGILILLTVLFLAFVEEFFWDKLINHERYDVFGNLEILQNPTEIESSILALFTAILALPQIWHYFVDGIIWKANDKNPKLKTLFKHE